MSLISGEISFPKKSYLTVEELLLPENENIRYVDSNSLHLNHNELHKSVEGSQIVKFFNGKSVFLTGGTGFIGKLITEKLLRTCEGIGNIYLLVRPRKGKDVLTRFHSTYEDVVFSELKKVRPNFRCMIVPIEGDISEANLGISIDDRQKLIENVDVIIHCAATVGFDEPLRRAAYVNVRGTKEIMCLAQQCKHLVSLVHVSTAYSQCLNKEIREQFYEPPYTTEEFLRMIDRSTDEGLALKQESIIKEWPNTYSFTKAIAEHAVWSMAENIPTAICRPSVVTSTYKEPLRSWVDNLYGPMGFMVGTATGVIRTINLDEEKFLDVIPADYIANGVIAAAYQNQFNQKGVIEIYNNASTAENPITSGDFYGLSRFHGMQNPTEKMIWYFCNTMNKNKYVHFLYEFCFHLIPALLIDGCLFLTGRKRRMVNLYKKIHKFTILLSFFTLREWKIHNDNQKKLWNSLNDKDKEIFDFSVAPEKFNWNKYLRTVGLGVRLYLLKDSLETIPAGKKIFQQLYYIHTAFKTVCLLIALRMALVFFNAIRRYFIE